LVTACRWLIVSPITETYRYPVGEGRRPVEWPAQVLVAGRRHPGVVVMPAHGLSLEEVTYPPDAELGARHKESRVRRVATGD